MTDTTTLITTHTARALLETAHPGWNWGEAYQISFGGYVFRQALHAKLAIPTHNPSQLCGVCLAVAEETMIVLRPQVADLVLETIRVGMQTGGALNGISSRQIQKACFGGLYDHVLSEVSPKLHSRLELDDHDTNELCEVCMQAAELSIRFFVPTMINRHITTVHSLFGWQCPSTHQSSD